VKLGELEKYETVKRWITSVMTNKTKSEGTRRQYIWQLARFCEWVGKNPDELIREREMHLKGKSEKVKRQHEELLMRYFAELEDRGLARWSALSATTAVRSFYKSNYVPLQIRTPEAWERRTDKIPTLEEIKQMVDASESPLQRAIIIFSAQSGQRAGVITALRYGMVRRGLEAKELPLHVHVPAELRNRLGQNVNKRRITYDFFVGRDGVEALNAYLRWRVAVGDEVDDEAFLFVSEKRYRGKFVGLDEMAVNMLVKRAAVKAGLIPQPEKVKRGRAESPIHHHCLRKFYQTAMEAAGIAKPWYEYMMGHKLGKLDRAYSKPTKEQLREAYRRAEPYLSISKVSMPEMDQVKRELLLTMWRDQAKMFGIDPMKVRIEKGRELTPEEEIEAIQSEIKRLRIEPVKFRERDCRANESRLICEDELVRYLNDGWEIVRELRDGRIVVRR
jgi:site-specific recombinase XerD